MDTLDAPTALRHADAADRPTYTHEEALAAATEYFGGDTLAAGVWLNKYALKDSFGNIYERTPDEMHRRIAAEIARVESRYKNPMSEDDAYALLRRFRFLVPQGSPMSGIGNPFQVVSLSNCFVIGVQGSADSYGAILKMDEEQVQLMKRRGGVGHDLSHLRPTGTPVMNSALTSTGILPFMERYSNSTREVAQDGRRGALMLTLAVQHPDAPFFVDAKMDSTKVTGANISLRLDDEFMQAVCSGKPYRLRFPVGSKKPLLEREISASDLWKKIVHNAWKSAEPGLLFWDTVLRESVPDCYADLGFGTVSTNPCLTGDALVAVSDGRGHIPIKELAEAGLDVPVYCLNEQGRLGIQMMRNPRLTGEKQKVYKLTLDDGSTIRATGNHKFRLKNGEYREMEALQPGDSLMILTKFQGPVVNEEGKTQSNYWWLNEGTVRANKSEHRLIAEVRTLQRAMEQGYIAEIWSGEVRVQKKCEHCGNHFWTNYHRRETAFCSFRCNNVYLNANQASREKRTATVNATYSQRATVVKNRQLEVFTRLKYDLNRIPKMKEWESACRDAGIPSQIGTKHGFESYESLKVSASLYNHRVVSVEFDGYEDVYNGTVDHNHNFFAGGWASETRDGKEKRIYLNQKNCGEIPLCPYDSCRLLAINLLSYVQNPFSPEASFDFDLLKQHGELAQRVMDDIIDLELEKIEQILAKLDHDPEPEPVKATERELWLKIREKCLQGRRTGIGITAEGDMLAALGIRYGSDESLDFCENLHRTLALSVYRGSVNLARERGPFPIYDSLREEHNPFVQRLREADPELYTDMVRYGRRNIALLTIAPTGTTSLMTQTTSGLEPVFRISYKRRKKVNPNDKNARVSFTDAVGDSWEDYHVFHIPFRQWLETKGYDLAKVDKMPEAELQQIIEQSPWYRATAEDVDWVQKVHLQGRVQKWVDHSISVTVNVPEEATEDLIEKIYLTGWEAGCKGMTVYREGSRSGVLVSDKKKDDKKETFTETAAPKRPKVLDAVVVSFMNNDERWVAVVGLYQERPYEIFTGRAVDSFSILTQVSEGKVIKVKEDGKNRYDFQYMDKSGYRVTIEGLSRTFNKEYWNYARLISGVLRHGMPLPYVVDMVENLHLETASLNNWKNGVVRALRKFIPDGTAPSHNTCPACKTDNLVYQEGCLHCKNCGHSECN